MLCLGCRGLGRSLKGTASRAALAVYRLGLGLGIVDALGRVDLPRSLKGTGHYLGGFAMSLFTGLCVLFVCCASFVGLVDASLRGDLVLVTVFSLIGGGAAAVGVVLDDRLD